MIEAILKHGKSIKEFETPGLTMVFTEAETYPEFFKTNLIDDARVIKVFKNDPQANIRVFYYQYLKLCFEIQHSSMEFYIQKVEDLLANPDFHFLFPLDQQSELFTDQQFKRLFIELFGILNEGELSVDQALAKYPIADTVLIFFFRTLLISGGKTSSFEAYIDKSKLYEYLIAYFGIQISVYEHCLKFVDTDIFVYEDNQNDVYMVYMDYQHKALLQSQRGFCQEQEQSIEPRDLPKNTSRSPTLSQGKSDATECILPLIKGQKLSNLRQFFDFTQQRQPTEIKPDPPSDNCGNNMNHYPSHCLGQITHKRVNQNQQTSSNQNQLQNYKMIGSQMSLKNVLNHLTLNDKGATTSFQKDSIIKQYKLNLLAYKNNTVDLDPQISNIDYRYVNGPKIATPSNSQRAADRVIISNLPQKYNYFQPHNQNFVTKVGSNLTKLDSQKLESAIESNYGFIISSKESLNNQISGKVNDQMINRFESNKQTLSNQLTTIINKKSEYFTIFPEFSTQNVKADENNMSRMKNFFNHPEKPYMTIPKNYIKGMNITKQFTDTFILQSVNEPCKSRIEGMKSRGRAARDSLYAIKKY